MLVLLFNKSKLTATLGNFWARSKLEQKNKEKKSEVKVNNSLMQVIVKKSKYLSDPQRYFNITQGLINMGCLTECMLSERWA